MEGNDRGDIGGSVTAIVIERLDRLARDLTVQEYIVQHCAPYDVVMILTNYSQEWFPCCQVIWNI
jgi:hypothetical protein